MNHITCTLQIILSVLKRMEVTRSMHIVRMREMKDVHNFLLETYHKKRQRGKPIRRRDNIGEPGRHMHVI
jgi:hypothetical protein